MEDEDGWGGGSEEENLDGGLGLGDSSGQAYLSCKT